LPNATRAPNDARMSLHLRAGCCFLKCDRRRWPAFLLEYRYRPISLVVDAPFGGRSAGVRRVDAKRRTGVR
jgi:hypothetical protein